MLERLLLGRDVQDVGGQPDDREIDAGDLGHGGSLLIGDVTAAVAVHDPKAVIERDQIGDCPLGHDTGIECSARLYRLFFGLLIGVGFASREL